MAKTKNPQISLNDYLATKDKKAKRRKFIEYPWPVLMIFTIPLIFFVILLLSYVLYIRRFSPAHG